MKVFYSYKIFALFALLSITFVGRAATTVVRGNFAGVLVPQYICDGTTYRTPYVYRATVSGLTATTTYRFYTQMGLASDIGSTNPGAGNPLFCNTSTFSSSSSVSMTTAGGYGTFTTDGTGSYTGWFGLIPTSNARFSTGGNTLWSVIAIGNTSGTVLAYYMMDVNNSVTALTYGTSTTATSYNCSALRGNSSSTAKNFVFVYDTITCGAAQRPISGTTVESDGLTNSANYTSDSPPWYVNNVDGVAGAWGCIIPNALARGIRRIEQRDYTSFAIDGCASSGTGMWPTGTVNTVSPTNSSTSALAISATDEPLTSCNTITTGSLSPGSLCSGNSNTITLPYSITGSFSGQYSLQYSDALGNFPTNTTGNIATYVSGTAGSSVTATLPTGLAAGTAYRVRVVNATGGYYASCDNGTGFAITVPPGNVVLASASLTGTEPSCPDATGWTYYTDPANANNWVFGIYKNGNTFTANVNITVKTATPTQYDLVSNAARKEANYSMGRNWNVTVATGSINSAKPVKVRFFYSPADTVKIKSDALSQAIAWGENAGNIHTVQWFKTNTGVVYSPSNNTAADVPNKLAPSSYTIVTGTINSVSYVEYDGLQGFSGGTAGVRVSPGDYALPVSLLYVTATGVDNSYIKLAWATASETDNSGFEIERSTDGIDFQTAGWQNGSGNSTEQIEYSFDDKNIAASGIYYYRLKQVDVDGEYEYSPVISAMMIAKEGFVMDELRPNPATGQVVVNVVTATAQAATVSIIDLYGRVVIEQPWVLSDGLNGTTIDLGTLSTGAYYVSVNSTTTHFSKKLIIAR